MRTSWIIGVLQNKKTELVSVVEGDWHQEGLSEEVNFELRPEEEKGPVMQRTGRAARQRGHS